MQPGGCADFYVLLFGVLYLAWCNFAMDPTKEQWVCIRLCKSQKKMRQRPWQWLDKCLGKKAWAVHRCLNGMFGSGPVGQSLRTTHTQVGLSDLQCPTLAKLNSWFMRINVEAFKTLLMRWKLVMGHSNRFWLLNWACIMLAPNLCLWLWQLIRSSSVSTSARNFVRSPPMI